MDVTATTASAARDEFLNLLVTQLRNQDPLEPVKQEDFLAQLAQFSTLEGVEQLNSSFEGYLHLQEEMLHLQTLSGAANLVGQEVVFNAVSEDAPTDLGIGTVDSVVVEDGQVRLSVNGESIAVSDLVEIRDSSLPAS